MKEPYGGRKCGAQKRNAPGGDLCKNPAGSGTDHPGFGQCKNHMGSTPGPSRGAFRQMVAAMGEAIQTDPAQALTDEIARAAGHVAWLGAKIAEFEFPEQPAIIDENGVTPPEVDREKFLSPNQLSWYAIYQSERKHLVDVSAIAIKAGLAERTVQLAERQGELLALAIERILGKLELSDAQANMVPEIVPNILRELMAQPRAIEK